MIICISNNINLKINKLMIKVKNNKNNLKNNK